jgi:predicted transglutaminase-like cysteine proteinase
MLFATSLLFVLLLYVLPLHVPLAALVGSLRPEPGGGRVGFLVACALLYVVLLLLFNIAGRLYRYFGLDKDGFHRRVAEWNRSDGCRWLNFLSWAGILGTVAWQFAGNSYDLLQAPLHAAVLLGLHAIMGRARMLDLPDLLPLPDPLVPPPEESRPVPPDGESAPPPSLHPDKTIRLSWPVWEPRAAAAPARPCEAEFRIRGDEYAAACSMERPPRTVDSMASYARDQAGNSLAEVVGFCRAHSRKHYFTPMREVMHVVGLCRAISYAHDSDTHGTEDYWNFPVETLYEECGDCEDHGILAAALLKQLGHEVGLFLVARMEGERAANWHAALAYHAPGLSGGPMRAEKDGKTWFFIETAPTRPENGIGDIMALYHNSQLEVHVDVV